MVVVSLNACKPPVAARFSPVRMPYGQLSATFSTPLRGLSVVSEAQPSQASVSKQACGSIVVRPASGFLQVSLIESASVSNPVRCLDRSPPRRFRSRLTTCGEPLIRRFGYRVTEYQITPDGRCPSCFSPVPGRWADSFRPQITDRPFWPMAARG